MVSQFPPISGTGRGRNNGDGARSQPAHIWSKQELGSGEHIGRPRAKPHPDRVADRKLALEDEGGSRVGVVARKREPRRARLPEIGAAAARDAAVGNHSRKLGVEIVEARVQTLPSQEKDSFAFDRAKRRVAASQRMMSSVPGDGGLRPKSRAPRLRCSCCGIR